MGLNHEKEDDFFARASAILRDVSIPIGVGGVVEPFSGVGSTRGGAGPEIGFSRVTACARRGSQSASVSLTLISWVTPLNLYNTYKVHGIPLFIDEGDAGTAAATIS